MFISVRKKKTLFFMLSFVLVVFLAFMTKVVLAGAEGGKDSKGIKISNEKESELLKKVMYRQFSTNKFLVQEKRQYGDVTVYTIGLYTGDMGGTIPVLVYKIGNNFFINGTFIMIDSKDGYAENISSRLIEQLREKMQQDIERKLPEIYLKLDKSKFAKIGTGKEKNEAIVFASFGCPHCKRFLNDLIINQYYKKYDTTFYVAINGDEEQLKHVLCGSNKEIAINDILNNKTINDKSCNINPIEYHTYYDGIAEQLNINGVPTFITKKCVLSGYYPEILEKIKECQ